MANTSEEVRRMFALFLYEHRRISLGRACEIAGITQREFADMSRRLGIPLHYSAEDLREDMKRLADVRLSSATSRSGWRLGRQSKGGDGPQLS